MSARARSLFAVNALYLLTASVLLLALSRCVNERTLHTIVRQYLYANEQHQRCLKLARAQMHAHPCPRVLGTSCARAIQLELVMLITLDEMRIDAHNQISEQESDQHVHGGDMVQRHAFADRSIATVSRHVFSAFSCANECYTMD